MMVLMLVLISLHILENMILEHNVRHTLVCRDPAKEVYHRDKRQTEETFEQVYQPCICLSPRSGLEHKAWGEAKRNPRIIR